MRFSRWKLLLPLGALAIAATALVSTSLAASEAREVRVAIMTDCKGAFGANYENDIGGAQAAFAQYAAGKPKSKQKPSAGMTGIKVGGTSVKIVGYGCGDDTAPTAIKETRRLMEGLKADVMVGPLSGDEAVAIANYAKGKPTKTFIIGTAASQDPTMQIAPKNVFRYHGDGAQWNAGLGEIVYKKLGWRNAAIIMDDYSFAWTSAAGIIADFCAIGGKITKRVFPPLNTTDYAPYVQQLPKPDQIDGYFWVVGGTGTGVSLKAMEQANGKIDPKQLAGNLFLIDGSAATEVAPLYVGSYVGGFGTAPGLKKASVNRYVNVLKKWYPSLAPAAPSGFVYNYYNAAWALVRGLAASAGVTGAKLQASMPRTNASAYEITDKGLVKLDSRRQAIQDQYQLLIGAKGVPSVIGFVPNVDQTFSGVFGPNKPAPGRAFPPCVKRKLSWQGKIKAVNNGVVTNQVIK
jgi:branched-chain amino acid transport system substrate-binding protein